MPIDLDPEEQTQLRKLLRDTIWADKFKLSARVQALKRIMGKLDPEGSPVKAAGKPVPRPASELEAMLRASVAGEEGMLKAREQRPKRRR